MSQFQLRKYVFLHLCAIIYSIKTRTRRGLKAKLFFDIRVFTFDGQKLAPETAIWDK